MNPISVPVLGLNARWSPAPYAPMLQGFSRKIGQATVVPPPTPAPAAAAAQKPSLFDIDAPLPAFMVGVVASTSTAILGYSFGKVHSRWSTFFWAVSGITGFKALVDLSRLK